MQPPTAAVSQSSLRRRIQYAKRVVAFRSAISTKHGQLTVSSRRLRLLEQHTPQVQSDSLIRECCHHSALPECAYRAGFAKGHFLRSNRHSLRAARSLGSVRLQARARSGFLLSPTMVPSPAAQRVLAEARPCPDATLRASSPPVTCRTASRGKETHRLRELHEPVRSVAVAWLRPPLETELERAECRRGFDVALIQRSLARADPDTRTGRVQAESQILHPRWPYPISLSGPSSVSRFRGGSRRDFLWRDLQHRLSADVHEAYFAGGQQGIHGVLHFRTRDEISKEDFEVCLFDRDHAVDIF